LGDIIVGAGLWFSDDISFLDRMAMCFFIVCIYCSVMTLLKPLPAPVEMPVNENMDMTPSPIVKMLGYAVVALTVILYIVFW